MTESYRVLAAAAERLSEDDLASWSRCRGWTRPTCCSTCRWTPRGGFSFALYKEVIDGLSDLSATIRRYRDSDKAAVYDVCVRTANAGRGVGGRYSTDDLVPDVVAGPYLFLEPRHAYVLDNGERAVGYIIGTASTPDFVAAYPDRWLPRLRDRYQPLSGPPVTEEEQRLDAMFHPERWLRPELAPHPAHLHINLLPGYRRSGHGRELMSTFLASVAAAGAPSCYLSVRRENVDARRFYERLGWRPIEVSDPGPGVYLVRPTS